MRKVVILVLLVFIMFFGNVALAKCQTADVLLLQDNLPWGSNADTTVLSSLGYTYEIKNMSDVPSLDLSKYYFVLIVNDQSQSFYDSYAIDYSIFQNYVEN